MFKIRYWRYHWLNYKIIKKLGSGGNATVYKIQTNDNQIVALKKLHKNANKEKESRFTDEIAVIKQNYKEIVGILPIIWSSKYKFEYTMPIAEPIVKYIKEHESSPREIVLGIIDICNTLSKLHTKNISHRDIKPSNLYFYDNRYYIGDFGLVDLPDGENNYTREDRGLGAIFTIAPEMKRNPKKADGKKADVYSLAKTLWMLLSLDETGFEGVYDFSDSKHSLKNYKHLQNIHLVEIEELLKNATDNTPENRPSIDSFKNHLLKWLEVSDDYSKYQRSEWQFLNKYFLKNSGETIIWRNPVEIVTVLNVLAKTQAHNHMLFSSAGGQDFLKASLANEDGCIYIYDDCKEINLVKPKALFFERFDKNEEWNYLLLECQELNPVYCADFEYEILVEDYPAHYVSAEYEQYGVYDYDSGKELPSGYKVVARYLKGKFLFVLKSGPYNKIPETYDGRHGEFSHEELREYTNLLIKSKDAEYKAKVRMKEDSNKPEINEARCVETFIRDEFKNWIFDVSEYTKKATNIAYYITLTINDGKLDFDSLIEGEFCLCNDGYMKRKRNHMDEIKLIYDKKEVSSCIEECEKMLTNYCKVNNFDGCGAAFFSFDIQRCGKPEHLFTKEEIKIEMEKADDRKHNTLVIDENGYAKVVSGENLNYYPVRQETWHAGNGYVGKYSNLSTLDDDYMSMLQGWLNYLETNHAKRMDYLEPKQEKELLERIREFY